MKNFKELMLEQFTNNARYEIEKNTDNVIEVWDKEMLKSFEIIFDNNGNLKEIF